MASLEDLAALLVGQATAPDFSVGDRWSPVASGVNTVGSAAIMDKNLSKTDRILGAIASGLISGAAQQKSADYRNRAKSDYLSVIANRLEGGPELNPEGLDPTLLRVADDNANLFKVQQKLQIDNEQRAIENDLWKQKQGVGIAREMETAKELGKLDAYGNTPENRQILSPIAKEARDIEDKANAELFSSQIVDDFSDLSFSFESMKNLLPRNDRQSSTAFISSFIKVNDPGSVIRGEEVRNAENSVALANSLGYNISSLMNGTQQIAPEDKLKFLGAAAAKYNALGNTVADLVSKQKTKVQGRGGKADNIYSEVEYKPFDLAEFAKTMPKEITIADELGIPTKLPGESQEQYLARMGY